MCACVGVCPYPVSPSLSISFLIIHAETFECLSLLGVIFLSHDCNVRLTLTNETPDSSDRFLETQSRDATPQEYSDVSVFSMEARSRLFSMKKILLNMAKQIEQRFGHSFE